VADDNGLVGRIESGAMKEEQDRMQVQSYRDLLVWQRSIQLSVAVYEFTRHFPAEELYGLRSQLRRASVSVASNIAEGSGRRSTGEYVQFLGLSRGSNYEVQTQLVIAREMEFGAETDRATCVRLSIEVEKMLNAFMGSLSVKRR
jgi:four helix bundle protein